MKYLVCNVFGMAAAVACLALVVNRPAEADDEKASEQKKVIVVQVEADLDGAREKVQEVIDLKLKDLPEELKKKIEERIKASLKSVETKLEASSAENERGEKVQVLTRRIISAKEAGPQERPVAVWIRKSDGDGKVAVKAAECPVCSSTASKTIQVRVAADDIKDGAKTMTVKIEDGEIWLNGKPLGLNLTQLQQAGKKETEVEVEVVGRGDKKASGRMIILSGEKGEVQQFHFDQDAGVETKKDTAAREVRIHVQKLEAGKKVEESKRLQLANPRVQEARKKAEAAHKKAEVAHKKAEVAGKEIHERAEKAGVQVHEHILQVHKQVEDAHKKWQLDAANAQLQRATEAIKKDPARTKIEEAGKKVALLRKKAEVALQQTHAEHAHADLKSDPNGSAEITQRLKGIEAELKKIRQLLEKMAEK